GRVEDDGRGHDPRRLEVLEDVLDQRDAADLDHRLRHAQALQARAAARRDHAAGGNGAAHASTLSSSPTLAITGSAGQQAEVAPGCSQMCRMPIFRAPSMSRGSESPTKTARSELVASASSAAWKMRGSGLVAPTASESIAAST